MLKTTRSLRFAAGMSGLLTACSAHIEGGESTKIGEVLCDKIDKSLCYTQILSSVTSKISDVQKFNSGESPRGRYEIRFDQTSFGTDFPFAKPRITSKTPNNDGTFEAYVLPKIESGSSIIFEGQREYMVLKVVGNNQNLSLELSSFDPYYQPTQRFYSRIQPSDYNQLSIGLNDSIFVAGNSLRAEIKLTLKSMESAGFYNNILGRPLTRLIFELELDRKAGNPKYELVLEENGYTAPFGNYIIKNSGNSTEFIPTYAGRVESCYGRIRNGIGPFDDMRCSVVIKALEADHFDK